MWKMTSKVLRNGKYSIEYQKSLEEGFPGTWRAYLNKSVEVRFCVYEGDSLVKALRSVQHEKQKARKRK
jgi:hypothetical protein